MRNTKQGFAFLPIVIILVLLVGGAYLYKQKSVAPVITPPTTPPPTSSLGEGQEGVDTTNWKTYTNEKYGFEVKYPAMFSVSENSDELGKGYVVVIKTTSSSREEDWPNQISVSTNFGVHCNGDSPILDPDFNQPDPDNASWFIGPVVDYKILCFNKQQIVVEAGGHNLVTSGLDTLGQILSTFRFTK